MNNIGISLSYINSAFSVYSSNSSTAVQNKQEDCCAPLPKKQNDDINDEAIISDEAQNLLNKEKSESSDDVKNKSEPNLPGQKAKAGEKLTQEQLDEISKLKAADTEVKAHEQAHIAAAAGINTSAPSYSYKTGPDGKQYAVAGEVQISIPASNDPEETIQNAKTMKAAALAPADPSSQDLSVAQHADQIIANAEQQLTQQKQEEAETEDGTGAINKTEKTIKTETEKPVELIK